MSIKLIETINLNKYYNNLHVIKNKTVIINEGVYLLKGINGSGKTTFIKLLMKLIVPTSGEIVTNFNDFRYVPELLQIKSDVKVLAYIKSVLSLRKLKRDFDLENYLNLELDKPINTLSKGNLKKVLLYLAFVGKPEYLFLDEPLDGLDKKMKNKVISYINNNNLNCLISSHLKEKFKNFKGVINFD